MFKNGMYYTLKFSSNHAITSIKYILSMDTKIKPHSVIL